MRDTLLFVFAACARRVYNLWKQAVRAVETNTFLYTRPSARLRPPVYNTQVSHSLVTSQSPRLPQLNYRFSNLLRRPFSPLSTMTIKTITIHIN